MKKISLIFLGVFLAIAVAGYLWLHGLTSKIMVGSGKKTQYGNLIAERLAKDQPINIVLLGYGGGSHDGAYLTDSMIVASVNPREKRVTLISVPRDIYVNMPTDDKGGSYWKINAAYEIGLGELGLKNIPAQYQGPDGGGKMVEAVTSKILGIPVDYFVAIDFNGFKNTIDALGGVDVNVEITFTDYEYPIDGKENDLCGQDQQFNLITDYINNPSADQNQLQQLFKDHPGLEDFYNNITNAPEKAFPCRYKTIHFDRGMTHMDGESALEYVRSRHSLEDGTDFGRAKRQRNLLEAVEKKVFSAQLIPKIIPFMQSLADDFRTDLSLDEIKTFVQNANNFKGYQIANLALTDQNFLNDTTADGQFVLLPKAGKDNWGDVKKWIAQSLDPKALITFPTIQVENGTTTYGLAQAVTDKLKNDGYFTLTPISSKKQNFPYTQIISFGNVDKNIIDRLKKDFSVPEASVSAHPSNPALPYNVLLTVGANYSGK